MIVREVLVEDVTQVVFSKRDDAIQTLAPY